MNLAGSKVLDKKTEDQSQWNNKKPPKTCIVNNIIVPIIEPITDIKSLLKIYGVGQKLRWSAAVATVKYHDLDSPDDKYHAYRSAVKGISDRKRRIAAIVDFTVPNNQKVIELTFLDIVE